LPPGQADLRYEVEPATARELYDQVLKLRPVGSTRGLYAPRLAGSSSSNMVAFG
jgi:hypothetical protein